MIGCARSHLRMPGSAGAGHAALNGRASSWTRAAARAGRAERRDLRVDRSRRRGEGAHVDPAHPAMKEQFSGHGVEAVLERGLRPGGRSERTSTRRSPFPTGGSP